MTFEKKITGFTTITNTVTMDRTLSLKAKGLFLQLASLPDTWDFSIEGLTYLVRDGKDGIRSTIIELENHGYLKRERIRNENGSLGDSKYTLFDNPTLGKPTSEKPTSEKPTLGNPSQYINNNTICKNTIITNKKENVCSIEHTKENPMESLFEVFWSKYPKKQKKKDARVAFLRNVSESNAKKVFDGLEMWLKSEQWSKDHGRYIPLPTSWLNEERWNDELKTSEIKDGGLEEFLADDDDDDIFGTKKGGSYIDADFTTKA